MSDNLFTKARKLLAGQSKPEELKSLAEELRARLETTQAELKKADRNIEQAIATGSPEEVTAARVKKSELEDAELVLLRRSSDAQREYRYAVGEEVMANADSYREKLREVLEQADQAHAGLRTVAKEIELLGRARNDAKYAGGCLVFDVKDIERAAAALNRDGAREYGREYRQVSDSLGLNDARNAERERKRTELNSADNGPSEDGELRNGQRI